MISSLMLMRIFRLVKNSSFMISYVGKRISKFSSMTNGYESELFSKIENNLCECSSSSFYCLELGTNIPFVLSYRRNLPEVKELITAT